MNKLLIIDGNSILNRAFYGIRMLNALDGTPTNAVYGFLNILFKQLDEIKPDGVCVAFDVKEKTFRHKMYDLYKAQRKPAPEDFLVQIPIIKEVLQAMNITCLEKPGYEADDIIGTVSRICEECGVECNILTGDKDDLQLASKLVKINLVITKMGSTTTTVYDDDAVFQKYGVTPVEFIDVKGLMGDTSDNIPGVLGIGEKTAFSLISNYKSIENIYEKIDEIEVTKSVREKLSNGRESAELSKILATIDRNVPGEYDIESYALKEYGSELGEIFTRLNFKQFMSKLNLAASKPETEKCKKTCRLSNEDSLLNSKSEYAVYRFYPESNSLGVAYGEEYFYFENVSDDGLKSFFESHTKKIGYNIKEDVIYLKNKNIEYNGLYFDVMIGAYIINPVRSGYNLSEIALEMANVDISSDVENSDGQLMMDFGDEEKSNPIEKIADELFCVERLYDILYGKIKENNQEALCFDIEMPLIKVLADMQYEGVLIDKNALIEFGEKLDERIRNSTMKIYDYAGKEFNINSPKQLGEVLFADMGLPHGKKTKTGYSTNAEILEKLKDVHPIIAEILDYRRVAKLKSTYVDGLLSVINPKTGRIHSNFNQTVTATGRISSTEPNLQNIPVRTALGREMRKMFVAADDKAFADADYSQIELRVLSHIADDENMKNAFLNKIDVHTQTAAKVFKVEIEDVTPEMRTGAKAVNFGIVYGISEFSLSQDLKISFKEAKRYIEDYFESYPDIKKYLDNVIENGTEQGYVSTIFNRRRYMPELKSGNKITRAFGQRVAMNAPIQGSAADIIKIAMVNVYNELKERNLKSKLVLQIHDELIVETCPEEIDEVREILKSEMENAVKLSVPLEVELNIGKNWFDTK
ncbi:MAG: DNA polymerase I [Ruminococcaceae bacterium]|nr:DNA polymerase I [Oscillospiraceae bacterium]